MSDDAAPEPDAGAAAADDRLEEVREAAGAVVASLRQLLEAAERVISDPDAFAEMAAGGKSVVEAFVGGFTAQAAPPADHGDEPVGGESG